MVTATVQIKELQMAFAAGAIDYITKPLNKVELLARVSSALRLKREIDNRKAREQELLKLTQRLEELNQMLQRLSSLDGLTGIANRRHFDLVLKQEWRRAIRDATPLSLVLIDVDFFKAYNDTYGHQMGDDCLKRVTDSLKGVVKRPTDLIARYGGEEFVVLLPKTDIEGASALAEEMRTGVEALGIAHARSQVTDRVTISLGVATIVPNRDSSSTELVAEADQALYRAKQEGRNRVKSSNAIVQNGSLIKEITLCKLSN
jgi:diguanylate cyclase (GGDEF)-like protein